jgi:hypothetical protein
MMPTDFFMPMRGASWDQCRLTRKETGALRLTPPPPVEQIEPGSGFDVEGENASRRA